METIEIDHSETPIRLFKSDTLEFFTHVHPAVVLVIWLPVAGYALFRGITDWPTANGFMGIFITFMIGLLFWTLAEYLLHRFLFHFHTRKPTLERVFFLLHGIHHAQPQSKTRLVMPPAVSIPLALVFYAMFQLLIGKLLGGGYLVGPIFSGFISGYIFYDMVHYATHHFPMRSGIWKGLKRHHMRHHYKSTDLRFGVSSPLWDYIFDTLGE